MRELTCVIDAHTPRDYLTAMSVGGKSKTTGRWQDAVVTHKTADERSTDIGTLKVRKISSVLESSYCPL